METKYVNFFKMSEEEFYKQIKSEMEREIDKLNKVIESAINELDQNLETAKFLYIKKYDCLINVEKKFAIKNYENCEPEVVDLNTDIFEYLKTVTVIPGLESEVIKNEEFKIIEERFEKIDGKCGYIALRNSGKDNDVRFYKIELEYESRVYMFNQFSKTQRESRSGYLLPVNRLDFIGPKSLFMKYYIPYGICNNSATDATKLLVEILSDLYKKDYLIMNDYSIEINSDKLISDVIDGSQKDVSNELIKKLISTLNDFDASKTIGSQIPVEEIESKLLKCEKVRADIEEYDPKILTDPNRGHWDLWSENSDYYKAEFNGNFFARNPMEDIKENGVIAIDFGTKSTVVVFQSEINQSLPMGIGDGNISKEVTAKRYENPTVMHFVDIAEFLKAYNESDGRPNTKWNDITISHTAVDQFKVSKSSDYYQYLSQIKQWAGERKKQFRIKQKDGTSLVLPAFTDLTEDDFNPIEIYAYYIGLYINNMRNGIFLDYYLSFPVTYETKIREKIIESFKRGLKKSLPPVIINNPDVMSKFRVNGNISEPIAYAVCALQEYGFDPEDNEFVFYSIFDFGGGTTDFDFGLWTRSKKTRRYDYSIESLGSGGDKYLGGENMLEMLAFEVFKKNQEAMRKNGFTFTLPPKCTAFAGSEALIASSQEAEKNMHNLMEALRPFWEINKLPDEIEEDIDEQIRISLFNKNGEDTAGVSLNINRKEIQAFIEDKIREGINNFFSALLLIYENPRVPKPSCINILLAGNSCRSPYVKRIFEEEINKYTEEMQQIGETKEAHELFKIFPPLGTEEAYKIMEERGIAVDKSNFEKPTGKTGVAFGLLQCRNGGAIEKITPLDADSEIPFPYFIGWNTRKKFEPLSDKKVSSKHLGKPDYGKWYEFIDASDADVFELYYTTLPECISGQLSTVNNAAIHLLRCEFDPCDNANIYIRAIDPHTIEYAVAMDHDVEKSIQGEIYRKELK